MEKDLTKDYDSALKGFKEIINSVSLDEKVSLSKISKGKKELYEMIDLVRAKDIVNHPLVSRALSPFGMGVIATKIRFRNEKRVSKLSKKGLKRLKKANTDKKITRDYDYTGKRIVTTGRGTGGIADLTSESVYKGNTLTDMVEAGRDGFEVDKEKANNAAQAQLKKERERAADPTLKEMDDNLKRVEEFMKRCAAWCGGTDDRTYREAVRTLGNINDLIDKVDRVAIDLSIVQAAMEIVVRESKSMSEDTKGTEYVSELFNGLSARSKKLENALDGQKNSGKFVDASERLDVLTGYLEKGNEIKKPLSERYAIIQASLVNCSPDKRAIYEEQLRTLENAIDSVDRETFNSMLLACNKKKVSNADEMGQMFAESAINSNGKTVTATAGGMNK